MTIFDKVTQAEGKYIQNNFISNFNLHMSGKVLEEYFDLSAFQQSVICFRFEEFWPSAGAFSTPLSSNKWITFLCG